MTYTDLINRLIDRRCTLHLSQYHLADLSGIYQPAVHRYEKFKTVMQVKTLLAVIGGLRLRLMVEDVCITSGAQLYGVIRHALVKQHTTAWEMLEALGYSRAAYCTWDERSMSNTQVDRALAILAWLKLGVRIEEEENG